MAEVLAEKTAALAELARAELVARIDKAEEDLAGVRQALSWLKVSDDQQREEEARLVGQLRGLKAEAGMCPLVGCREQAPHRAHATFEQLHTGHHVRLFDREVGDWTDELHLLLDPSGCGRDCMWVWAQPVAAGFSVGKPKAFHSRRDAGVQLLGSSAPAEPRGRV